MKHQVKHVRDIRKCQYRFASFHLICLKVEQFSIRNCQSVHSCDCLKVIKECTYILTIIFRNPCERTWHDQYICTVSSKKMECFWKVIQELKFFVRLFLKNWWYIILMSFIWSCSDPVYLFSSISYAYYLRFFVEV